MRDLGEFEQGVGQGSCLGSTLLAGLQTWEEGWRIFFRSCSLRFPCSLSSSSISYLARRLPADMDSDEALKG